MRLLIDMPRFLLILLLTAEFTAAVLIVALLGGLLPTGPVGLAWLLGACLAFATAVTAVFPEEAKRVARHAALVLGAVLFMLPFLWLVSTSFKQPEETFTYPPRWLPEVAAAPVRSPWTAEGEPADQARVVRLGAVRVQDRSMEEVVVEADWSATGAAVVGPGGAVSYDFTAADAARLVADLPVPVDDLAMVSLRMRQDASWHGLSFALETDGRRYESDDLLYLGVDGWREWSFRLPGVERRDERELGIWPLRDAGPGGVSSPASARLLVTIRQKHPFTATLARWTRSYRDAWYADEHWGTYILNSIYLVVLTVVGQVLSCSMAAYAFARLRWPGREVTFGVVLATMMLPTMVVMVPQFLIFKTLGWYNTLLPLWVPAFLGTPFFIFLLRQFMLGVPRELEEAARIDGCSWWGIYWRIMLPLLKPALAAVAIFTFMTTWNEFMGPLIYLSDERLYPLSLGLFNFRGEHVTRFNMLMAASTLMTLPVIAIFFLAQRYFIEGITVGGVKG